ncbi:MAG: formate--tetrahydrofolate ligase [Myxococcota bacterium]
MRSDVDIAQAATVRPIGEIASRLGVDGSRIYPYGHDKAKLDLSLLETPRAATTPNRLILVSAITPTRAGEGKTTTTIGLGQALDRRGKRVCLALREPSLGPCMGVKGGACGGGYSQVVPMESINLHFTGDLHAITSAHNLLAAVLDNQLHFGGSAALDPRRIAWKRVIDMNDRALRHVMVGMGGPKQGVPRETGFDITAASEVMAMLCLAETPEDLRARIDRTLIGFTRKREPVLAGALGVTGSVMALLQEAMRPNLVQTLEHTPAIVHGGPFANIAHGCNSVLATRMAMHLSDWTVTEAGFGFDLGGEKFLDIKCPAAGLNPAAIVLVATVRALKLHGGVGYDALTTPDPDAVQAGLPNLARHVESAQQFGKPVIVALNRFASDSDAEIEAVAAMCRDAAAPFAVSDHHARGGEGALDLADTLIAAVEGAPERPHRPLYDRTASTADKIHTVATRVYGAGDVAFTAGAEAALRRVDKLGYGDLPVCIAKTQSSLSDDPKRVGRPEGFTLTVRDLVIQAGAGFVVALTGDLLRMPGLPRRPAAEAIDLVDGRITGLS